MRFFCIHTIIFRYVSRHEVRAMTSHIYNNMSWSNVNLLRFFSPETVDCRLCRQVFWLASLSEVLPILYGQWTSVEFIRKVLWSSQQWVCSGVSPDSLFTSFNKIYHEAPESRILKSERKYRYYKSCKEEYSKKRENEFNVLFSLVSLLGSVLNTLWIAPIYSLYPVSYTHLDVYKRQPHSPQKENDQYLANTNPGSATMVIFWRRRK